MPTGRKVAGVRWLVRGLVAASALLLAAGCSPGDASSAPSSPDDDAAAPARTPRTTTSVPAQPPGERVGEVQPLVEDLLARYDEVVHEIVADPSVVDDPGHTLVEEFLGLFEPGSDFASASIESWAAQADDGITLAPSSPDFPVNVSNVDGAVRAIDDDEVRFAQCAVQRYVLYRDGEEAERVEERLLAGEGRAVRVEGRWLLAELTTPPDLQGCRSGSEAPR
jgi:hypothetical protein